MTGFCTEGYEPVRKPSQAGGSGLQPSGMPGPALQPRQSNQPLSPGREGQQQALQRQQLRSMASRGHAADRAMSQTETSQALATACCSICSLKGNKSSSPNQDRALAALLCHNGDSVTDLLAVFDGHGDGGHWVSELACEVLPKLLLRSLAKASSSMAAGRGYGSHVACGPGQNPQEAAGSVTTEWWREASVQAFEDMHALLEASTSRLMAVEEADAALPAETIANQDSGGGRPLIDARTSGTTATVALLLPSRRLLVAHVGDSRAVLGTRRRGGERERHLPWRAVELTRDHKPDLPDERLRITEAGAQVVIVGCPPHTTHRVFTPRQGWPSINMSRSLGDLHAHTQGLSAAAEVNLVVQLWDPLFEEAVIILGSDGIWDVIDGFTAVDLAAQSAQHGLDPAAALAQEAYERWGRRGLQGGYSDDITAIVKFL